MGLLSSLTKLKSKEEDGQAKAKLLYLFTEAAVPAKYEQVVKSSNFIIALVLSLGNDYHCHLHTDQSREDEIKSFTHWDKITDLHLGQLRLERNL